MILEHMGKIYIFIISNWSNYNVLKNFSKFYTVRKSVWVGGGACMVFLFCIGKMYYSKV